MVQAVELYRTTDGMIFESQDEASAHEAAVKNKAAIEDFLDRHFPIPAKGEDGKVKSNPARGPVRRALAMWLAENA